MCNNIPEVKRLASNERNYNSEFKKLNILNYVIVGFLIVITVLCLVNVFSNSSSESDTDYDVSMMRTVSVDDVLELFDSTDTYVLYIGRETCDICQELLPTLQTAQLEHNYITQYLDITNVDRTGSNWEELVELLDATTTATITNDDGETEEVTETYGYFLDTKGMTPCVIIISNGEMTGGFFGNKELTTFEDWLSNNGI